MSGEGRVTSSQAMTGCPKHKAQAPVRRVLLGRRTPRRGRTFSLVADRQTEAECFDIDSLLQLRCRWLGVG